MRRLTRILEHVWPLPLAAVIACGSQDSSGETPTPEPYAPSPSPVDGGDTSGPGISFTPVPDGQEPDAAVPFTVQLADESGIYSASLFFRATGTDYWGSSFFSASVAGYTATIPREYVQADGVDYYVTATDASSNRNTSVAPAAGPDAPLHFTTRRTTVAFPYLGTFEPSTEVSSWELEDTGWSDYVEGFDDGQNWQLEQTLAHSGTFSAFHGHGSPYQTGEFVDYLVSPPIDLSSAGTVDLYWWESSDFSEYAAHRLLVSTGSPDPEDGEFVELIDPLPVADGAEDSWAQSQHVDLSGYAGQPQVFVAFVYQGLWADDWYLDDVTLEAARADVAFGSPTLQPDPVEPGGSSAASFAFANVGLVESAPLTAALTTTDTGVTISPEHLNIDAVAAGETELAGPFQVAVDAAHPDDTYLPLTLSLTDGDQTWTQEARLQIGRPPVAHIGITHTFEDDLQVFLGYGDPATPDFIMTVQQDDGGSTSGSFSWDIDISDYATALPPDSDAHRWFVQVWDDSAGNSGTLDAFSITIGDQTYDCGGLPRAIPDDTSSIYAYLPGRAEFAVGEISPPAAGPGDDVTLTVTLENFSSGPQGPLSGRLSTMSPDVRNLNGDAVSFEYTTLDTSDEGVFGTAQSIAPFTFTIDSGHTDSSHLEFSLLLTDGIDEWSLLLEVPVPYPVFAGLAVSVEDAGTDGSPGDEALSPNETSGLRLRLRNAGDLASFGPVSASIHLVSDGGTGAFVDPSSVMLVDDTVGDSDALSAGHAAKADSTVPVQLKSGTAGDEVTLEIVVTDGVVTHTEQRTLVVSEVPWNPLTALTDAAGDANGYPLDLAAASFWRQGSQLKIRWQAHYAFDIEQTFLYSYVSDSAAYRYAIFFSDVTWFYRWNATGSGYWYRITAPASLYADQIDDQTIELGLDLAEIGLGDTALYGGGSSDTCGGTQACDYAPDETATGEGQTRFW